MIPGTVPIAPSTADVAELFDPGMLQTVLESAVVLESRRAKRICDVRVDRCWPTRDDGFRFQWSFGLGGAKRHTLVGVARGPKDARPARGVRPGRVTRYGIRRLRAFAPQYNLAVFSIDRDPRMPHMRRCLDPEEMALRLQPFLSDSNGRPSPGATPMACKPLTYKAGRRAAIAYRVVGTPSSRSLLLGKTYRDDRARNFEALYKRVGEQLLFLSGGRVGGPSVVGFIRELRMALFAWRPGRSIANGARLEPAKLRLAVEVLCTLHRVELDGLPTFSAEDELAIACRWQAALQRAGHPSAANTRALLAALAEKSRTLAPGPQRTVHRDFYEQQLIWSARRTTLLDLDTLTWGDPCLDLGTFFAHAYLDRLRTSKSKPDYAALLETFLPRYERNMGKVDPEALRYYCASAAFRLGAVHALRCNTRAHSPALWGVAKSLLGKRTAGCLVLSRARRPNPRITMRQDAV